MSFSVADGVQVFLHFPGGLQCLSMLDWMEDGGLHQDTVTMIGWCVMIEWTMRDGTMIEWTMIGWTVIIEWTRIDWTMVECIIIVWTTVEWRMMDWTKMR